MKLTIPESEWRFFDVEEARAEIVWLDQLSKRPELNDRARQFVKRQLETVSSRPPQITKNTDGIVRDYGDAHESGRVVLWINFNAPGKDVVAEFEAWLRNNKKFKEGKVGAPKTHRKKLKELAAFALLKAAEKVGGSMVDAMDHAYASLPENAGLWTDEPKQWRAAKKATESCIEDLNRGLNFEGEMSLF